MQYRCVSSSYFDYLDLDLDLWDLDRPGYQMTTCLGMCWSSSVWRWGGILLGRWMIHSFVRSFIRWSSFNIIWHKTDDLLNPFALHLRLWKIPPFFLHTYIHRYWSTLQPVIFLHFLHRIGLPPATLPTLYPFSRASATVRPKYAVSWSWCCPHNTLVLHRSSPVLRNLNVSRMDTPHLELGTLSGYSVQDLSGQTTHLVLCYEILWMLTVDGRTDWRTVWFSKVTVRSDVSGGLSSSCLIVHNVVLISCVCLVFIVCVFITIVSEECPMWRVINHIPWVSPLHSPTPSSVSSSV